MIHTRSDDSEIKCAGYKGSKTSILFSNVRFDLDFIANIFLRCYKFYVVRVSYINSSGIEASSILSISCLKVQVFI